MPPIDREARSAAVNEGREARSAAVNDERRPSMLARLTVEYLWLLALPLIGVTLWGVFKVLNPYDLSFLVFPGLVKLAVAVGLVTAVFFVPYLIFRGPLDLAREDVALHRDAHLGVKDAQRRLRRFGPRLSAGQRQQIEAAIGKVQAAQSSESGLSAAITDLEGAMEEHLSFARKGPTREYAESIGVAVFIALLLRAFVVEAFKIPSGSMIPTLQVGDHIFVNKFIYGLRIPWTHIKLGENIRPPRRGEVIVFIYPREPDKDFIKRIVAVAGDTVDVKGDKVYVNGRLLPDEAIPGPCVYDDFDENSGRWHSGECIAYKEVNGGIHYTLIHDTQSMGPAPGQRTFPLTVPPQSVFVMGDNRDNSHDSRYWGFVPYDLIKGKAWIIWYSAGQNSSVRIQRMFDFIHP